MMQDPRTNKGTDADMTTLGSGARLKGDLHCSGSVSIEGMVDGTVRSQGTVLLQESARVKGELSGARIVISGEIRGNVQAGERLEIQASGKLLGNITAPVIFIQEGAFFEGQCSMQAEKDKAAPGGDKTETAADKSAKR